MQIVTARYIESAFQVQVRKLVALTFQATRGTVDLDGELGFIETM